MGARNMEAEAEEFEISQLRLCDRKRHAYQVKQSPNTHLRGRPKKIRVQRAI